MRFLAILAVLLATALAFPRLGLHEGYTRMVFDLEGNATYQLSQGDATLTIRFQGMAPTAADTEVDSPQVASYQVVTSNNSATVYVRLKPKVSIKTTLIKDDQGRRLVVDLVSADPSKLDLSSPSKLDLTPALNRPKSAPPKTQAPPKIVVLDPGHGGIDSGAVGFVVEKEATLDVALRVRQILQGEGIQVVMTRSADTQLSTDKRTDLGMRANMANSKRSLFVAIHVNSSPSDTAQGIETYYFGDTIDPGLRAQVIQENGGGALGQQLTQEAQSVANQINSDLIGKVNLLYSRRLAAFIQNSLVDSTGAINRGTHSAPFYVIRKARIPAILVEVGFTSNPSEGKKLETSNYRENIAQAIAAGILRFLNNGASASR